MNGSAPVLAHARREGATVLAAAAIMLATGALFAALSARAPKAYYQIVQEDGFVEWATFWACALAGVFFLAGAVRCETPRRVWLALLGAFALFVGFEEISWGQRVLGYRAPVYFLERNFQQELNVHNVASTGLRELAWVVVAGGWGVAAPLFARIEPLAGIATRAALVYPPLGLLPVFAGLLALQLIYPLPFTGEIVELVFGLALLFIAVRERGMARDGSAVARSAVVRSLRANVALAPAVPAARVFFGWAVSLALVVLAAAAASAWSLVRQASPESIAMARAEVAALAGDFMEVARLHGESPTACGLHKRLYTFASKYRVTELSNLEFASLASQGATPERIAYFLDPWNSPYWVRDHCSHRSGRRAAFVYSFGPNQRRDSSAWELAGDDIGIYLARSGRRQ